MSDSKRRRILWIATPLRSLHEKAQDFVPPDGNLTPAFFEAIGLDERYYRPILEFAAINDHPYAVHWVAVGGGGVARARNRVASEFMAATTDDDDTILWVDYDLMPTAQDYCTILSRDLDICGALYTVRAEKGWWVLNRFPLAGLQPTPKGLFPVMELGTGFKAMKRRVFRRCLEDLPWLDCESDFDHSKREYGFFSMGPVHDARFWPGKHRWLTEDYWLDWICRSAGFTCIVDQTVKLRHYDEDKHTVYPLEFPPEPGSVPLVPVSASEKVLT